MIERPDVIAPSGADQTHERVRSALDWLRDHGTDARRRDGPELWDPHEQRVRGVDGGHEAPREAARTDTSSPAHCGPPGCTRHASWRRWSTNRPGDLRADGSMVSPTSTTGRSATRFASTSSIGPRTLGRRWRRGRAAPRSSSSGRAFALLWSLALHDKQATDDQFVDALVLAEREAGDERPLVKKAATMALYAVGRRNAVLTAAATATAETLSASPSPAARTVGRSALKRLSQL